jgi:hypothetical protein
LLTVELTISRCGRAAISRCLRRLLAAIVLPAVVTAVVAGGALGAPALAGTGARPLHLAVLKLQFTSFTCLNDACSLAQSTVVGDATSNLSMGPGSFQAVLTIDFSPGGTCNIVDEPGVFTFANGTILTHSHHEDCAIHGLRIDTTFRSPEGPEPRARPAADMVLHPAGQPRHLQRTIS